MSTRNDSGSPKISRRRFVQGAAAAVTMPMFIPASALGLEPGKPAANSRIAMGFIGIGKQSSGHLNHYSGRPDTVVLAVCDVHKGRRERAKTSVEEKYKKLERKDYKACDAYVDYKELLARKDIDAIVIGTPDHWHTTILIEAAKAKKDTFCEKPLTLTIRESMLAIEAVNANKVVFQTGSQQRSDGPFREVCEYIRSGRLGKIKEVLVSIGTTSKPCDRPEAATPEGLEWDMWLGQAPKRGWDSVVCSNEADPGKYPFNPGWRDFREYSGGHVTDWGAHHFDITHWALGMDGSGPNEILPPEKQGDQYGAKMIYHKTPVGDNIVVTHTNKDGNGIRFIGEKGEVFVNRGKKEFKGAEGAEDIFKQPLSESDVKLEKSKGHHENWVECIRSRKQPICNVEVGAGSVAACHLVNLAYWHNRKLRWDPKKWEFDNAEDNKLRDREQRDGYKLPVVGATA